MRHNFRNVLAYFYKTPWAIHPAKFAELEAVLWRRIRGEQPGGPLPDPAAVLGGASYNFVHVAQSADGSPAAKTNPLSFEEDSPPSPQKTDSGYTIIGNAAIIPITGTISPRPSLFDEWSGGVSHEGIGKATNAALSDGKVETIVYDIDSPGGVVYGMEEAAQVVAAAKKTKPTTAVSNFVAASAAYWYASQAGEIVISPSGQVGSIGVIVGSSEYTKMYEQAGINSVLISNDASPYKVEGWPQTPMTPEAIADMRQEVNGYAQTFIAQVAKGRGIRANKVEKEFGQGRMLLSQPALEAGMVDRIDTMQSVIESVTKAKSRASRRNIAAQMVKLRLPTA